MKCLGVVQRILVNHPEPPKIVYLRLMNTIPEYSIYGSLEGLGVSTRSVSPIKAPRVMLGKFHESR